MVSLDLSIVNVAFPALRRRSRAASAAIAVVGDHRVLDRVRLAARRRRPHRRPRSAAQARLPRRHRRRSLLGSALCGLAPSVAPLSPAACCKASAPRSACRRRSGCCSPPTRPSARSQIVALWGGDRRARGRHRALARRADRVEHAGWRWAFFVNLPVGALFVAVGPHACCPIRRATPAAGDARLRSARCCCRCRVAALTLRDLAGRDLGLDRRAAARSPPRSVRCSARPSSCARTRHPATR